MSREQLSLVKSLVERDEDTRVDGTESFVLIRSDLYNQLPI